MSDSHQKERSEKGNTMSGMSLYKRLLKYHTIFKQRVQGLSPGVTAVYSQLTRLFFILFSAQEEACSVPSNKGGLDG